MQIPEVAAATYSITATVTASFSASATLVTITASKITPTITVSFSVSPTLIPTTTTASTVGTTTYITYTLTGWLTPDAAHLANALILIMLPLGGLCVMTWMGRMFKMTGDTGVYLALAGLTAGAVFGDLSATGVATNAIPFAMIFIAALLMFLYWWNT